MKTALVDIRMKSEAREALASRGFSVIPLPPECHIAPPLASHTDMLVFSYGQEIITSAEYRLENADLFSCLEKELCDFKFTYTECTQSEKYPRDAIFNALVIEDKLFCKTDSVCPEILNLAKRQGLRVLHVNQGYPACLALYAGGLAITSDKGLADAFEREGIDTLLITESEAISLPPYKFGFIGGATGTFGDTVYFIGDIDCHPEASEIKAALLERGIKCVSLLPNERLHDLGGILFL